MPYKDPSSPAAIASRQRSHKKHYDSNRQYFIDKAQRRREELTLEVRKIKEASPCVDCGVRYPFYVMQFDHTGTDKIGNVSNMVNQGSRTKVMSEIEKCELVCANCHCIRTWNRSNPEDMPL